MLIGVANRVVKYFTSRSLYGKSALAAIAMVGAINATSVYELFITEILKPSLFKTPDADNCSVFGPDQSKLLLSLFLLSLAFYWVRMAGKAQKMRAEADELVFEKHTGLIGEIGSSRVHAFCGSITHISGIDIVVTSENTDLNLGSVAGTSVSGRVRDMAATRSATGEIVIDNIANFIQAWKASANKFANFPLGHYIVCSDPYEAASKGIKTIIFAIAIKKNSDGTSTIDEAAINKIVCAAIDTAISKNQRSLFIPVFGLGSGNSQQRSAINVTTRAVKAKLGSITSSMDVYLGVYRIDDLTELCMSINQS